VRYNIGSFRSLRLMGFACRDCALRRRRRSQVAYVPQSDVLIPSLTVQECLRYSALLRLPQDTSPLDLQVNTSRGVVVAAEGGGGACMFQYVLLRRPGGRFCPSFAPSLCTAPPGLSPCRSPCVLACLDSLSVPPGAP
jgi:hypothetical protein